MGRARTPRSCCPLCGLTPLGEDFASTDRACDPCTRYTTLVRNAAHERRHVRTPGIGMERAAFVAWARATPRVCYACGIPERLVVQLELLTQVGHRLRRLGIDRLRNEGDYTIDNIAWCCFPCNKAKSSTFSGPEMAVLIGPAIGEVWRRRLRAGGVVDPWIDPEPGGADYAAKNPPE